MDETKLEQTIEEYKKLGEQNKNVDVAALMLNALKTEKENLVSPKMRKWAYLVSIGAPPLGLLFALKLYFSSEDDAKHVANVCIILTVISVLLFWLSAKIFFSSSGTSLQQIQQIKPADIYQLGQ